MGLWFIFTIPPMLLAMWAAYRVRSTFSKYAQVANAQGLSGMDVARRLMRAEGLDYLQVNQVPGSLTDFYNPLDKSINLSQGSVMYPSVGGLAVVAHELGHALQDKEGYVPMRIRGSIVGVANIGSRLGVWLVFGGLILGAAQGRGGIGFLLAVAGLVLMSAMVFFTLVTLPVEFDASRRAREMLMRNGLVTVQEQEGVAKVLNAAALTYVASAAQAVSQLLYFALIIFGGRRSN
jgi:Zn-dependent membrane protease YugP